MHLRGVCLVIGSMALTSLILVAAPATMAGSMGYSLDFSKRGYLSADKNYFRSDQVPGSTSIFGLSLTSEEPELQDFYYKVDGRYFISTGETETYFNIKELYMGWGTGNHSLSFGGKLQLWSRGDKIWQRGLYQSRFMWDKLRPEEQGLVGFHYHHKKEHNEITIFASPLFVPEMGPEFRVDDNGYFRSANPWFRPPPKQVEMFSQVVDNYYDFDRPETMDVVNNPSVAVNWLHKDDGFFVLASAAYKPMNQILLASPAVFDQPSGRLDIVVKPQVIYHNIVTLEVGLADKESWHSWISVTKDEPHSHDKSEEWISQRVGTAWVSTGYLGYDFDDSDKPIHGFVSLSVVNGGDISDSGQYALEESYYERRFQYTESLKIGFTNLHKGFGGRNLISDNQISDNLIFENLSSEIEVLYDFEQKGSVVKLNLGYKYTDNLFVGFKADVLGLTSDAESEFDNGFVQNYRANDNIELGVKYGF